MKQINGIKVVSVGVPVEFLTEKQKLGVTWRVLIARGLNSYHEVKNLKEENEYFLTKLEDVNKRSREQQRKLTELLNFLQKAGIDTLNLDNLEVKQ